MPRTEGRQINLGIGIESTAGTAVAATVFPKWTKFSLQAVAEKSLFKAARGQRNESSNSMIRRKYAEGSLACILDVEIAPYLFRLALGTIASATASGESAVYEHTITVQNNNAQMKTATVLAEDGTIVTERYTNVVVNSLDLQVSDEWAEITAELLGKFPDTGTVTESYAQQTEFAYHNMTVKFGTSLSNAAGQSATPLKLFTLNIANNIPIDEAFLSGSNIPVSGGFAAGNLVITGSYAMQFSDTTELDKYKANTKNAAIISFQGAAIGIAETEEIMIKLGRLVLTKPPKEYNLDGLILLNQEFTVEFEATDKEISVIVTNTNAGASY